MQHENRLPMKKFHFFFNLSNLFTSVAFLKCSFIDTCMSLLKIISWGLRRGKRLGQQLSRHLGSLYPMLGDWVQFPVPLLISAFSECTWWDAADEWFKYSGPYYTHGKTTSSSQLLTLACWTLSIAGMWRVNQNQENLLLLFSVLLVLSLSLSHS